MVRTRAPTALLAVVLVTLVLSVALVRRVALVRGTHGVSDLRSPSPDQRAHELKRAKPACARDYESCSGGLPSPIALSPCCSDDFFCFRRGPYFSQCRPRVVSAPEPQSWYEAIDHAAATPPPSPNTAPAVPQTSHSYHASSHPLSASPSLTPPQQSPHTRLCAHAYGVCAAGIGPDSSIPCCDDVAYACQLSTLIYHQCLPKANAPLSTHTPTSTTPSSPDTDQHAFQWFSFGPPPIFAAAPFRRPRFAYMRSSDAARAGHIPISAEYKLHVLVQALMFPYCAPDQTHVDASSPLKQQNPVTITATLPKLHAAQRDSLLARVRDALASDSTSVRLVRARLVVRVVSDNTACDAAMTLASFPEVRDMSYQVARL